MKINYQIPIAESITLEISRKLMQDSIVVPVNDGGIDIPDMPVDDFNWS